MNNNSAQKGLAPLILVIIAGVVITGVVIVSKGNFTSKKPSLDTQTGQTQQKSKQASGDYSSFDNKISIQTPSGWQLKENSNPNTQATFFSPKEGKDDKFIENVNLHVSDLSAKPNATLENIVAAWNQSSKSDYPESFEVVSEEKTTLAGVNAIKIIAKAKDDISSLKSMTIFVLKDGKSYILNYSAEENSFDKYLPDVEKLLTSVKLEAQQLVWEDYKSDQYGYSLKYPKGWIVKDQSGSDKREVLIVHPMNLVNAMIAARKDESLKDKASLENAITARKEFHLSGSGFKMGNFDSQVENKKGGWTMVGEKTIDGKQWAVMERGLIDIYGKVLLEQSGYLLDGGKDYKEAVIKVLDSFEIE